MTLDRWCEVNSSWTEKLTDQELKEGWHFCVEFDGLLVGPGMGELNHCRCECANHLFRPPERKPDGKWPF